MKIEVDAAGTLRVGSTTVPLGSPRVRADSSGRGRPRYADDRRRCVDAERRGAIVLERTGATWKQRLREPIGGVGLDADYGTNVTVTPFGVMRYQTRPGYRRCDGKPALLFADGFDGRKFRRLSRIPTGLARRAGDRRARRSPAPATAPVLYQARVACCSPAR